MTEIQQAPLDRAVSEWTAFKSQKKYGMLSEKKRGLELDRILKETGINEIQLASALNADEAVISPPSGKSASSPPSLGLAPNLRVDPNAAALAGGMAGATLGSGLGPAGTLLGGGLGSAGMKQGAELVNQYVLGSDVPRETGAERMGRAGIDVALDIASAKGTTKALAWGEQFLRGLPASGLVPKAGVTTKRLRQDYTDLGVRVKGALASLRPGMARRIEALRGLPGSSGIIDRALNESFDDVGRTAWSLVDSPASVRTPYGIGQDIGEAFSKEKRFIDSSASGLYENAFALMPKPVEMQQAASWLAENPGLFQGIPKLAKWEAVIKDRGGRLSAQEVKNLFGAIRQVTGDPVLASQGIDKGSIKAFRTAVQADLQMAAGLQGKEAVKALGRADEFYKQSQDKLEILDDILKGGKVQQAFRAAFEGAKDGPERLQAVKDSVPPQLWREMTTAKILDMGNAPAGQRGVAQEWNLNSFLTRWNDLSVEAKDLMFGSGTEIRGKWDALARVASSFRNVRAVQNVSNTSHISMWQDMIIGGKWFWRATGGRGLAYSQAKLLTNPRFVDWMTKGAEIVQSNPNGLAAHFGRLSAIAAREPDIADDIHSFIGEYGSEIGRKRQPTL